MAATTDTQRAAIRERKRQAHVALRERHQRQQAAQVAAFSALDRLARQLEHAASELTAQAGDPLERAAAVAAAARQLDADVANLRHAAGELATLAVLTQSEVAKLLGARAALLFPRPQKATRSTAPTTPQPAPVEVDT